MTKLVNMQGQGYGHYPWPMHAAMPWTQSLPWYGPMPWKGPPHYIPYSYPIYPYPGMPPWTSVPFGDPAGLYHSVMHPSYRGQSYGEGYSVRQLVPLEGGPERIEERPPKAHLVDWSALYPNEVILHGPRNRKEIALTFDDGPDDYWTPRIVAVLNQHRVKGTFMLVGRRVRQNPRVVQDLVRSGHIVGNHTYNHPNLTKMPALRIRQEIQSTADAIQRTVGVRPNFVRPPYGAMNEEVIREMIQEKHKIILWDVDSLDWLKLTAPQVAANVLAHANSGSIVLMHSAGGRGESLEDTVQALPFIIQTLAEVGYRFVTLPDLLNLPAYETARNG